jgi:hypothetical protein
VGVGYVVADAANHRVLYFDRVTTPNATANVALGI